MRATDIALHAKFDRIIVPNRPAATGGLGCAYVPADLIDQPRR